MILAAVFFVSGCVAYWLWSRPPWDWIAQGSFISFIVAMLGSEYWKHDVRWWHGCYLE